MKISARHQVPGAIRDVKPDATTTHVKIDEAAQKLGLKAGMKATAMIKASDVMVGA